MDKATVMERVKALKHQQDSINKQIDAAQRSIAQLSVNRNAVEGALLDCEHWLKVIEEKAKADKPAPKKKGSK